MIDDIFSFINLSYGSQNLINKILVWKLILGFTITGYIILFLMNNFSFLVNSTCKVYDDDLVCDWSMVNEEYVLCLVGGLKGGNRNSIATIL